MNTYDFDKTIFYPDSSATFVKWSLRRHPLLLLIWAPGAALYGLLYVLKLTGKEKLKEHLFSFIRHLTDIDAELELFWDEHQSQIGKWYLEQKKPDDLVISASPEFVVKPMTDRLGVRLMGTPMDKRTAKISGKNCYGDEKVRRFYEAYPNGHTEAFYSDSLSDAPMAEIADKAFLIINEGQTPVPWPDK